MSNYISGKLIRIPFLDISCPEDVCSGAVAVYRLCFGLAMFHGVLAVATVKIENAKDPRAEIHNGWWIVKVPLWIALVVLAFYLPASFYVGMWLPIFGAAVCFIFVQLVRLIDFAHTTAENWQLYSDSETMYSALLVGGSVALLVGGLAGTSLAFAWFANFYDCSFNGFLLVLHVVIALILLAITFEDRVRAANQHVGLFQYAVIFGYVTYLVVSAMMGEPDKCNIFSEQSSLLSQVVGGMFAFAAIGYSCVSTGSYAGTILGSCYGEASEELPHSPLSADDKHDEYQQVQYSYSLFHVTFALAACYIAMLLTDFGTVQMSEGLVKVGHGWASVIVKFLSGLVADGLYGWSLVRELM